MKKSAFNLGMPKLWLPNKLLLIMKLVIVILISSLMQVSAAGYGQNVTLKEKNASMESVISKIRSQTGYDFVFDFRLLENTKRVNVTLINETLESALKTIFKDQNLDFTIKDKIIVIKAKELSFIDQLKEGVKSAFSFNQDITGMVTDSLLNPLAGASVALKGSKNLYVISDNGGKFNFSSVPEGVYKIVITYLGYQKFEASIEVKQGIGPLNYALMQATSKLDQVQVIAYGRNTKRFSVGAVTTIDAETISNQPVTNVLLALQGQVAGLIVTPTGGAPGSAVKLQVRGQNSLRPTSSQFAPTPYDQPLFIVDGVPFAPQNQSLGNLLTYSLTSAQQSAVPGNGISPFGLINPLDIESVSVLKDADATSIYGSQGVNGVILITTKKGTAGKPQFNLNINSGFNAPTRALEMMNTDQYLDMRRQALARDNVVLTPGNANIYSDVQIFDPTRSVNWYKEFFDRTPFNTDIHASFSGGQDNSTFIFSGGYNKTTYNFPGDFADNRTSFHGGYTYRSNDNKFTLQFGTDYAYDKNNASSAPGVASAMNTVPNFPDMVDANGNLLWTYKTYRITNNFYSNLMKPANVQTNNLNNTVRLAYQLIPHLSISTNIGYSRTDSKRYAATPKAVLDPAQTFAQSNASFTNTGFQTINIEPQVNYDRQLGGGVLTLLLGGTYKKQLSNMDMISGSNYPNDDLLGSVSGAASVFATNSSTIYKYVAGFARINYIYDQKYIVNLSGRRDGSSNFGPDRRFGNFGSAGLGWIFTEESALKQALPFLSFGKLAANYGTNGSDGVAPYSYQAFYNVANTGQYLPYQGNRAYTPANLFNPNYSWSIKKSLNVSLDLGFFNDRLLVNATAYRNRTSDELINYSLPFTTGFSGVTGNFPATVQNKGLEFTVSSANIKAGDFRWTSNFNIGFNKNKLIAFTDLEKSSYAQLYTIGKSPNQVIGYPFKGLNSTTGLFEFYKANGTVTSAPTQSNILTGGDQQPLFDTDPRFSGGLGNNITYKNVNLSFFFQFTKQLSRNYLSGVYSYGLPGSYNNMPTFIIGNFWQNAGDQTEMQRLTGQYGNGQSTNSANAFVQSSGAYSDNTYLRLKTVSLSYNFPDHLLRHVGIKGLRAYVNAQNLLTFSNYKYGDPEQPGVLYTIPLQRTIVAGLNFNF